MRLLEAGPDAVAFDGEISEQACEDFERALDLLRRSRVRAPVVDLTGVAHISNKAVGVLVALWTDMLDRGRWFELRASDSVWNLLAKAGAAGVFFERPDRTARKAGRLSAAAQAGCAVRAREARPLVPVGTRIPSGSSNRGEKEGARARRCLSGAPELFAHDLRNILSSVRGYAQLLLSMADDDGQLCTASSGRHRGLDRAAAGADLAGKMVEYLAIVEAESSRCCDLIERILSPTRPPTEEHASGSDAARAAERVCELARGEGALKGVELVCEAEGELPPAAIPQEDLERVLLNLLRNGVQATPRGGRVEVRVRSCHIDGGRPAAEIRVSDTGRGVPEYAFKMIFEPFFSTHSPGEGLGLGLSISSALVERYGGSIRVESDEAAGTTFSVRLPAQT